MSDLDIGSTEVFDLEDAEIEKALDVEGHNRRSFYNVRGYAPVHTENRHVPLQTSGTLPADLVGVYLRTGPNVQFPKARTRLHPFNGSGMLHQVQILDGQLTYSNAYLRTPRHEAEASLGRSVYPAPGDIFGGGKAGLARIQLSERRKREKRIPDLGPLELTSGSTAVQYHQGRLYCFTEMGLPFVVDVQKKGELLVIDGNGHLENWNGALQSPFSAHPRIDVESGTFYNISHERFGGGVYYSRLENGELIDHRLVYQQDIGKGLLAWVHDYFVTANYIIFPDVSLRSKMERMLSETGSPYYFDPNYKLRWGLLPLRPGLTDQVQWFESSQAGFIWHTINGWEHTSAAGEKLITLFAPLFDTYPSDIPIHSPREPHAKLHKWVLNLDTGTVSDDQLLDHPYERPSINLRYSGIQNRFAYLLDESSGYMGQGVLKYDLIEERPVKYLDYGGYLGGEALFVPKSGASDEDDGYLLDILMTDEAADFVVFDAKSMTEVARAHFPGRVPFGVHACWLDSAKVRGLVSAAS